MAMGGSSRRSKPTPTWSDWATLASVEEFPVLVRSGAIMAATFHPELSDDARIHRLFLDGI